MSLCSPALLYLIIAIISIISMIYSKVNMQTIAMKGLFVIIYTWFLNFICSKGHSGISWFLVILPFVIMALFIVTMSNIIGGKMGQNKEMFIDWNVYCKQDPGFSTCLERRALERRKYCKENPEASGCTESAIRDANNADYCRFNDTWNKKCPEFCNKNPNDFYCLGPDYCKKNPEVDFCEDMDPDVVAVSYCNLYPSHPYCKMNDVVVTLCNKNPSHPYCQLLDN